MGETPPATDDPREAPVARHCIAISLIARVRLTLRSPGLGGGGWGLVHRASFDAVAAADVWPEREVTVGRQGLHPKDGRQKLKRWAGPRLPPTRRTTKQELHCRPALPTRNRGAASRTRLQPRTFETLARHNRAEHNE